MQSGNGPRITIDSETGTGNFINGQSVRPMSADSVGYYKNMIGNQANFKRAGGSIPKAQNGWTGRANRIAPEGQMRYVGEDTYEPRYSLPPFEVV